MPESKISPLPILAGFAAAAMLLVLPTGCTTVVDAPVAANAMPAANTIFTIDGDYDYFPGYNAYYNRDNHQYVFLEGGYWVSRPAPYGVATNVLRASPSVRMEFRDSPASHNAEMVRKYPHNWVPPGAQKQLPVPASDQPAGPDHT
jgi:hypothetical protein